MWCGSFRAPVIFFFPPKARIVFFWRGEIIIITTITIVNSWCAPSRLGPRGTGQSHTRTRTHMHTGDVHASLCTRPCAHGWCDCHSALVCPAARPEQRFRVVLVEGKEAPPAGCGRARGPCRGVARGWTGMLLHAGMPVHALDIDWRSASLDCSGTRPLLLFLLFFFFAFSLSLFFFGGSLASERPRPPVSVIINAA